MKYSFGYFRALVIWSTKSFTNRVQLVPADTSKISFEVTSVIKRAGFLNELSDKFYSQVSRPNHFLGQNYSSGSFFGVFCELGHCLINDGFMLKAADDRRRPTVRKQLNQTEKTKIILRTYPPPIPRPTWRRSLCSLRSRT